MKSDPAFIATVEALLKDQLMHDPSWTETIGVKALMLPVAIVKKVLSEVDWFWRHTIQGKPLSGIEKEELLTRRIEDWEKLSEKSKAVLLDQEAWAWSADKISEWRASGGKKVK
jgi:hypothetical protein